MEGKREEDELDKRSNARERLRLGTWEYRLDLEQRASRRW